jgi:protein-disulfide isomerase
MDNPRASWQNHPIQPKVVVMSKRTEIRERRQRRRRGQRLMAVGILVVGAVIITVLLAYPSIAPVGEVIPITPGAHPQATGRMLGDPNAPVLIELYEDFQCPTCRSFNANIEPLLVQDYIATGKARLVFRQFAFIGSESVQAANASLCAADQGRFWDYHDILFANQAGENQGAFVDRRLLAFAESLGLDMGAFRTCFQDKTFQDEADSERLAGQSAGVQSTPTILINGTIVEGAQPGYVPSYEIIAQAIEAGLGPGTTPAP